MAANLGLSVGLLVAVFCCVYATSHENETLVLNPPYFNIARGREIESTATCGEGFASPGELYCKLTGNTADIYRPGEHVIIQGQYCDNCDPADPAKAHPIEHAIDGTEMWWQSPPLSRGMQYNEVNVTINLGQLYQVAYILIKFANSPRPGMWILERSRDFGETFEPWQYFAETPSDCQDVFGMQSLEEIRHDNDVICTADYSDIVPLEDGEIVVSLVNNRPGAPHSATLQEWIKATHIRLRLIRTNTLLGHLMAVARQDPTITRRYYYSIKDITIGGRCACNGHATNCDLPASDGKQLCRCEHDTCGDECNECCPGFVQKAWRPSTYSDPFVCEPCNCYGHSSECVYDEDVAARRGSLDISGNFEGGGVCQSCQHNTMGVNCHLCRPGYYRPEGRELTDYDVCQPCNCDPSLSTGNCAALTGQCECRPEYAGLGCTECNDGYYGYPNCRPCDCNVNGTENKVCQVSGGQCPCKPNFTGRNCNLCALSYYGFPECARCDCDQIGSYDIVCDAVTGQCRCREVYDGRSCGECRDGHYGFPTCRDCSCSTIGSMEEICNKTSGDCLCLDNFGGDRCDRCAPGYYNYPECLPCNCDGQGSRSEQCADDGQCPCFNNYAGLQCQQCAAGYYKYPTCEPCNCDRYGSYNILCDQMNGQCSCRPNFQGRMCEQCASGFYNFPSCEECNCDPAGVIDVPGEPLGGCGSATGGACLCKDNVIGRTCDTCRPLYWNLEISNPYGCEDCGCNTAGTVNGMAVCDVKTGQCFCKGQVTGRTCDVCRDGTYRLEGSNPLGCRDCGCDVGGSAEQACNKDTGACRCKPRVTGITCNMPESAHFVYDLHQMKFEAEDGYTPNGRRVRIGYSENEFPTFSYLGYAVMSAIQPTIRIPITIESSSIYRIVLRYFYPDGTASARGQLRVIPADPSQVQVTEQSSGIIFVSTNSPQFVTVEGSGVIKPFVLNPGSWIVTIDAPEGVLIDYIVLLPSDFYEATILQQHVTEPCVVGTPQERCNYYVFPTVDRFYVAPGVDGFYVDGSGQQYPVRRFGDDFILRELGIDSMALVDANENTYGIDLPITEAGQYVLLLEYYGGGPGQQSALFDVYGSTDTQRGYLTLNDCSYLCRSVVLDDDGRVKIFDIQDVMPYAQLTKIGGPYMLAIGSVIAIPVESFTYDFVTPRLQCVRSADGTCQPSTYPVPPDTTILEGPDLDISAPLPPNIISPSASVNYLSSSGEVSISYPDELPSSGRYVFVVHYYQPSGESFDTNFRVVGQFDGEGTFNAQYCPHVSGCRVVVTKPDGSNVFDLGDVNQGIQISLPEGDNHELWIDNILVIPEEMYTPDVVNENPQDRAGEFIQYCGANDFYFSPDSSGFCREAVFSLSTAFNLGARACECDSQGSLSFTCEELGGQCSCRRNIVGRQCDRCAVGFYDFPYCRRCSCTSGVCNEVTGECICPENVAGANCDTCAPQTYGYHPLVGCVECECDVRGVANDDLNCDMFTGQCNCKPNVGGRQCERCEPGFYNYPFCTPCDCESNGTLPEICDQATAQCLCKANVEGDRCDQCPAGTFYLAASNPDGCISCFCFGVSTDCRSHNKRRSRIGMVDDWTVTNLAAANIQYGANIASVYVSGTGDDPQTAIYWLAPQKFIGSKLTAYGGKLEYTVRNNPLQTRGDGLGAPQAVRRPDILISGNNITIMYLHIAQPEPGQDLSVSVEMVETNFQNSITARPVSREDFLMVLANIDSLQIRAQYYDQILTADLIGVSMDVTKNNGEGEVAREVEICNCPPQYSGISCQDCAPGHYRYPGSGAYLGQCVPCNCNGHSAECDPRTGQCLECIHNTVGDQCERCKDGYYGDATTGAPDACRICSCPEPREDHNFATTCTFSPIGELYCICMPGHTGRFCDSCVDGYYGDPSQPGGICQPCQCSGNTDPSSPGRECDQFSGNCLRCLPQTTGPSCGQCIDWFYGDAVDGTCVDCTCDRCGSESCDNINGLCTCKPNVGGYDCERCEYGYWDYNRCQGCQPCDCGVAAVSPQCDMETGQCECMPGVGGSRCDACLHGYWNYGPNGCQSCNCDPRLRCDENTGECLCPPGAMGENCDECEPRYILTERGCQPCDECVHLLLDTLDVMGDELDEAIANLTSVGLGYETFQRLNRLNDSIQALQPPLNRMKDNNIAVETSLVNLTTSLGEIRNLADQVETAASDTADSSTGTVGDASDLLERARQVEAKANSTADYVREVVALLGNSVQFNDTVDIGLAEAILAEIRARDFSLPKAAAETERQAAQELLDRAIALRNASQEVGQRAGNVSRDIADFMDRLNELLELTAHANNVTDHANEIIDKHSNLAYEAVMAQVDQVEALANEELRNASNLLDQAEGFLQDAEQAKQVTERDGSKLQSAMDKLQPIIDHYQEEGAVLPELVDNATAHANNLKRQADELNRTFDETRNLTANALRAVNAYKDIANAINDAEAAARAALNASNQAYNASASFGSRPLDSKRRSRKLLRKAVDAGENMEPSLLNQTEKLRDQLNDVQQIVQMVDSNLDMVDDGLAEIERGIAGIPSPTSTCTITVCAEGQADCTPGYTGDNCDISALSGEAQGAANTAMGAGEMATEARDKAQGIIDAAGAVKDKLAGLAAAKQAAEDAMSAGEASVETIRGYEAEIPDLKVDLRQQHKLISNLTLTIDYNLAEIQKKIDEARSLANGIKVAAKFVPDSYASLRTPATVTESSPTSGFSFYFTTQAPDGLLYYVGGPTAADDYLALTMENSNLVFRYNLGDGDSEVSVAENVADGMWRYVIVERFGRYAKVTVRQENNGAVSGEAVAPGEFVLLDLSPDSQMYAGGVPASAQLSAAIPHRSFVGGLDELKYGDTPIGIWNFINANLVNQGIMRNVSDLAMSVAPDDLAAVQFDGSGYAIVPRGSKQMSIGNRVQLSFKTYAREGLLFFAGSNGEVFFIELRGGKVHYEYDLGNGPASRTSENAYNNNEWTTITVFRVRTETVQFSIQSTTSEESFNFDSPPGDENLETNNLIYIGGMVGIPDNEFTQVTRKGFRGCMKGISISQESVDLTASDVTTAGFFPACIQRDVSIVSFGTPYGGYLQLSLANNLDLMSDGDFVLRFRTDEPNGMMLYSANAAKDSSIAVMLLNGNVMAVAHHSGANVELTTSGIDFADGKWHTVNVRKPARRTNSRLSLSVDDGTAIVENFANRGMSTNDVLFIGGVPRGYDIGDITVPPAANTPFLGCIADASSKYQKISFGDRLTDVNAFFDLCVVNVTVPPQPDPDATQAPEVTTPTTPSASPDVDGGTTTPVTRGDVPCRLGTDPALADIDPTNENAQQFGINPNSRYEYPALAQSTYRLNYNISVKVRTGARNGLIYYAADANQIDLLALFLRNGAPVMVFDLGSGKVRVESIVPINDGEWHTVHTVRDRRDGELYIDGELVASEGKSGGNRYLSTTTPFYWGGVPPQDMLTVNSNDVDEISQVSLLGCMKELLINGQEFPPRDDEYEVSGCYSSLEPGVYFGPNKGYVKQFSTFNVGVNMEVRMSIKPRVKSGVLFSVDNPQMDFISLEMREGVLYLTAQNGAGTFQTTYSAAEGNGFLCDGNWHDVTISKQASTLQITVDGDAGEAVEGPPGATAANTQHPLYFGALPDGVSHQGIQSNAHYIGCMRDIMVNDDLIDLSQGEELYGDVDDTACYAN